MLIGFVLLVSSCGYDSCEALPVTEQLFPTRAICERIAQRIHQRRPNAILSCGGVYRDAAGEMTTNVR
ncbi:MAG: hypothetical protein XXXJIFNMEKO3_00451 [Candidatus Erwinia impunctatus]|nr:hypothetical protein XXXJIFNMEKO_00451 [Culicoides impunctatus]